MAVCRNVRINPRKGGTKGYTSSPFRNVQGMSRGGVVAAATAGSFAWEKKFQNKGARRTIIVRADPESVEEKIKQAVEVCDTESPAQCAEAWDEVEEVSAAAADKRQREAEKNADPLEKYCESNPETDECRIYED